MSFFDLFLNDDKKIQKHQRRLTNRDSNPEDREMSARWLVEHGTPRALYALLTRFDMKLTHQMHDHDEKEILFQLIIQVGDPLLDPLKSWLRNCKQFPLPLRLYKEMTGEENAVQMALDLLQFEYDKDDFKPNKKRELLIWLSDVQDVRCIATSALFLTDFDEGVRYSAVELILAQNLEEGREPLLSVLRNPDEESNRVKIRIAEGFEKNSWPVLTGDDLILPPGFKFESNQIRSA